MYIRLAGCAALLGVAAFAAWTTTRGARSTPARMDIDDDTAAEIIKRMLPALDRAYWLEVA